MKARENPYRSEQILKIRYRFQDEGLPELLLRLEKLHFHAALVGPEGSGKTTLLEDLEVHLLTLGKKVHWLRLTREFPRFSPQQRELLKTGFTCKDVLLFDGAEVLGRSRFLLLRWQIRGIGGLIVTTHKPGFLPTLLRTKTSPKLLGEILRSLDSEASRIDSVSLFERHLGNLREALRECYDGCMETTPTDSFPPC